VSQTAGQTYVILRDVTQPVEIRNLLDSDFVFQICQIHICHIIIASSV